MGVADPHTIVSMPQRLHIDRGSVATRCMDLGLCTIRPQPFEKAIEAGAAVLGGLHRHCLAHDGTSAGNDLKVGNCASSGRNPAGGGRETAERCGASGFQEWAHGTRLS